MHHQASLHRSFTAQLEPPPSYERHNTGKLVDDSGLGAVDKALRVLDLGCGDGTVAMNLAREHPGLQVLGLDVNEAAIAAATAGASDAGLESRCRFEVGDAASEAAHSEAGGFDIVLLQLVISVAGGPAKVIITRLRA
jgi:methylase of polypeptide subunit release factors